MKSFLEFDGKSLVIVIPMGEHKNIERPWLDEYIASCLADDDVFKLEFLSVLVFVGHQDLGSEVSAEVRSLFKSWGTKYFVIIAEHKDLLPRPHLAIDGKLYQVFRLYDDVQAAFLVSVRATMQSEYVKIVLKSCEIGSQSTAFLLAAMSFSMTGDTDGHVVQLPFLPDKHFIHQFGNLSRAGG